MWPSLLLPTLYFLDLFFCYQLSLHYSTSVVPSGHSCAFVILFIFFNGLNPSTNISFGPIYQSQFNLSLSILITHYSLLHPSQIHTHGHHGEQEANYNWKCPTGAIQNSQVSFVRNTQRPERTLKAMYQVPGKRNTANDIQNHYPLILKNHCHFPIKVMINSSGHIVIHHLIQPAKSWWDPKISNMNN